jgi:hypothetical protein
MKRKLPLIAVLAASFVLTNHASGQQISLAWSPSPGTNVAGYYIYASTNVITDPLTNAIRSDVGNLTKGTVDLSGPGTWHFAASAYAYSTNVLNGTNYTSKVESALSNQVIVEVPPPPPNMRTLVLQFGTTVTNWTDAGFFRIRILGP